MTLYIEEEGSVVLPFDVKETAELIVETALDCEECPYEAEVNLLLTDDEAIHEMNREHRHIDRPTDVLSFPMGENGEYDVNHDTGAKILGDIVISMEKAVEQASRYGHSLEREVGYLTAHSMLHLLGYDHEKSGLDRVRMREKEEQVMSQLGLPSTSSYVLGDE